MTTKPQVRRTSIVAHIKANPGQDTRTLAKHFGLDYEHLLIRLREMNRRGFLRAERIPRKTRTGPKEITAWFASDAVLEKHPATGTKWSVDDEQWLADNYWSASQDQMLDRLKGRTMFGIRRKAAEMKLRRDPSLAQQSRIEASKDSLAALREVRAQIRHDLEERQTIVDAAAADASLVCKAMARRTDLERAWSGA